MTQLLHRIGFVYKKPKLVPGKMDAVKQTSFIKTYQELKAQLTADQAIYFMDSVHPQYQAKAAGGWIRKGTNKTLSTTGNQKRMHIIGAIQLDTLHLVQADKTQVDGASIVEFLQQLEQATPDKRRIYLICDNARYHRSKVVKTYLESSKIRLVFLPPYSPNLNPIERLWKFLHNRVTANRFILPFTLFLKLLTNFLHRLLYMHHNLGLFYRTVFRLLLSTIFTTLQVN